MANEWLRLWHDTPNDPKFRTIAKKSEQPVSLVLAMFMHMLVDASRNVTRGHVDVTHEDLASALEVTEDAISAIWDAMDGRVRDGNRLTAWDFRQPKKEDSGNDFTGAKSAAERKRSERERKKSQDVTQSHEESRNVTLDKDKDKDKEEELTASVNETTVNQPAQPQSETARTFAAVDLSIAFRKGGVQTQPHNPILIAMAKQGITPDLVQAGCDEAKRSKPGEVIALKYVASILQRWASEASKINVAGAELPHARASPRPEKFNPTAFVNKNRVA